MVARPRTPAAPALLCLAPAAPPLRCRPPEPGRVQPRASARRGRLSPRGTASRPRTSAADSPARRVAAAASLLAGPPAGSAPPQPTPLRAGSPRPPPSPRDRQPAPHLRGRLPCAPGRRGRLPPCGTASRLRTSAADSPALPRPSGQLHLARPAVCRLLCPVSSSPHPDTAAAARVGSVRLAPASSALAGCSRRNRGPACAKGKGEAGRRL
nr:translation initiation factor IF-2-like [Aegilops tauschii subsp. strangulata]